MLEVCLISVPKINPPLAVTREVVMMAETPGVPLGLCVCVTLSIN